MLTNQQYSQDESQTDPDGTSLHTEEKRLTPAVLDYRERAGKESTLMGSSYAGDLVAVVKEEFSQKHENYLRGCKWSPDGNFILTNSNDNILRVFQMADDSELSCLASIQERELIYDFCWYSQMQPSDLSTYLVAATCRDFPIHLISSVTGSIVSSYRGYNHADEVVAAHSVAFTADGRHLLAGYNKTIRIFNTERPGRECVVKSTVFKDQYSGQTEGQPGIISCFAPHPVHPQLFAAGSFRGDVAIYSTPSGELNTLFQGQVGGVTKSCFPLMVFIFFLEDVRILRLFAGIRNPGKELMVMYRYVQTNQRMYFDIDCTGRYLLSGNHNGTVTIWDLASEAKESVHTPWPHIDPIINFQAHADTTNGCSAHPSYPLLTTASGQRHFPLHAIINDDSSDDDSDKELEEKDVEENTLRLWRLKLPGYDEGVTESGSIQGETDVYAEDNRETVQSVECLTDLRNAGEMSNCSETDHYRQTENYRETEQSVECLTDLRNAGEMSNCSETDHYRQTENYRETKQSVECLTDLRNAGEMSNCSETEHYRQTENYRETENTQNTPQKA
ncbi:LOW QUALITY PROTEIN: telomerase Cajal body protein 1-like [Pomacea canaliculata]|uniref:LOW QUALITY PROTEIN: telomerase Cajal body protein 1-like n=1 Tax=Pomacea canaliculata TaxID=400727 RepID=UPI000D729F9E|nr:LOW QUALITY PROTEIN: telomerase Cajal body protein 1-like [Pomacea canaliculata]